MSKKSRVKHQDMTLDFDDSFDGEFDDMYDEDMDFDQLSKDIYSTEWGGFDDHPGKKHKRDARRRIERRRDMQLLYNELDEFEEFGSRPEW